MNNANPGDTYKSHKDYNYIPAQNLKGDAFNLFSAMHVIPKKEDELTLQLLGSTLSAIINNSRYGHDKIEQIKLELIKHNLYQSK